MRTAPLHLPKKVTQKPSVNHIGSSDEPPIRPIGQSYSGMNLDQLPGSQSTKRHFSTMVSKPDCCAGDLSSIPGQVNFLENFILLNSSKIRREL